MSAKRSIECSDSAFRQEDKAKRAKLASLNKTTTLIATNRGVVGYQRVLRLVQKFNNQKLVTLLMKAVVMEVKGMKLTKSVRKEKADLAISRLRTVCSQWSSILKTNFFRNEVHRILEGTAQESNRLEILQQSSLSIFAIDVTTMKDEIFVLWGKDYRWTDFSINVYDRNNLEEVKTAIPLPERNPRSIAACNVSNCVYLLSLGQSYEASVLRITKDDDNQFNVSELISVRWLPNPTLSVTPSGNFILSRQQERRRAVISIYNANGSLQHERRLTSEIKCLSQIIPKSNGNLVLVYSENGKTKLTEISLKGRIICQYLHSVGGYMKVSRADIHGRMLMADANDIRPSGIVLLDSEFNLMEFAGPKLDAHRLTYPYILHYDSEKNEIISYFDDTELGSGVLTIFRFTDE